MGSVVFSHPVGFFELMPLVMIHLAVLIPIQCFENIGCGLGEIGFEFLPVHQIIAIRVHIPEMCIE